MALTRPLRLAGTGRRRQAPAVGDFRKTRRWQRLRLEILRRDLFACYWRGPACLGRADQADHVVPVSHGGAKWDPTNLVASCGPCNRARPIGFFSERLAQEMSLPDLSLRSRIRLTAPITGDFSRRSTEVDR